MNRSESIKNLAPALLAVQKTMGNAQKGASNPYFKSTYADLNSVRETALPVLNANNITCLQPTVEVNGKNFVETILIHESGEWLSSFTEIKNTKGDAQSEGSGISYARRYGLQSLLNIGAVDDDGEKTMVRETPKTVAVQSKSVETATTTLTTKKSPGRPPKAATTSTVVTTTAGPALLDNTTKTTTVTKLPPKVANGYSGNSTHQEPVVNEDEW